MATTAARSQDTTGEVPRSSLRSGPLPTRMGFCLAHFPQLRDAVVVDVGCGNGKHLRHFGPGSIGLDGRRLESLGSYRFIEWNFDADVSGVLASHGVPPVQYLWCSDVFEHHTSPHLFLLELRRALQDDGLLFLGVPLVNPIGAIPWFKRSRVLNYFRGYLSQDHVNFFGFQALRNIVRFAGFEVLDWYSPFVPMRRPPMLGLEPITVLVLRKVPGWQYGPKAYKRIDEAGHLRWKQLGDYTTLELPRD